MRIAAVLLLGVFFVTHAGAKNGKDKSNKRYLIALDTDTYPQDTPEKALDSVIKAMEDKKIDYLLAQLTDPQFVDRHVQRHAETLKLEKESEVLKNIAAFDAFVKEVTAHLTEDPTLIKDLKKIAKGEWDRGDTVASVSAKDNKEKRAFFRKIGNRWYFENRQKEKSKS
jgi:hypothetical protein